MDAIVIHGFVLIKVCVLPLINNTKSLKKKKSTNTERRCMKGTWIASKFMEIWKGWISEQACHNP